MVEQQFIVTDPPHGTVNPAAFAELLGLDVETSRLKAGFKAPELLSATDPETTSQLYQGLLAAGVEVAIVAGSELANVPWGQVVQSFALDEEGLSVHVAGEQVERLIPWNERAFVASSRPPGGFPLGGPGGEVLTEGQRKLLLDSGDGPLLSEAIQWGSILDLYLDRDTGVERITFARDVTDFSGLADMEGASAEECMVETVTQCALRFQRFSLDRRLDDVRPRTRFSMGADDFDLDQRKLFSFGTLLLRQALNLADSTLGDLTQYELGSRLAWVLRGRPRA